MEQQKICTITRDFVSDLLALGNTVDINLLLTPENVLIGEQKISLRQTVPSTMPGMPLRAYPGFSAPEVYQNRQGAQTSVYFVGAVMYTLVKGVPPADAQSRALQPGQPVTDGTPLADVINKALSLSESERYQDLNQLKNELAAVSAKLQPPAETAAQAMQPPVVSPVPAAPPIEKPPETPAPAFSAPVSASATEEKPLAAPTPEASAPATPASPVSAAGQMGTMGAATAASAGASTPPSSPYSPYSAQPREATPSPASPPSASPSPYGTQPQMAPAAPAASTPAAGAFSNNTGAATSSTPFAPSSFGASSPQTPHGTSGAQPAYGQSVGQPSTPSAGYQPSGTSGFGFPSSGAATPGSAPGMNRPGFPSTPGQPSSMASGGPSSQYGARPGYGMAPSGQPYGASPQGYTPGAPGMRPGTPGMGMPMQPPAKKKSKKGLWISLVAVAVVAIAFGVYTLVMNNNAKSAYESQDYAKVISSLDMAPWMKGGQQNEYDYSKAMLLYEDGDVEGAIEAFEALGDFSDSADLAKSIKYDHATELMDDGDLSGALALFKELGSYKDSAQFRSDLTLYMDALKMEDPMEAFDAFTDLGTFLDSADRASEIAGSVFDAAMELYQAGEFASAGEQFLKLGSFKNADLYVEACDIGSIGYLLPGLYLSDLQELSATIDVGPVVMMNGFLPKFLEGYWMSEDGTAEFAVTSTQFGLVGMGEVAASYSIRDKGLWQSGASQADYTVEFVSYDEIIITNVATGLSKHFYRTAG